MVKLNHKILEPYESEHSIVKRQSKRKQVAESDSEAAAKLEKILRLYEAKYSKDPKAIAALGKVMDSKEAKYSKGEKQAEATSSPNLEKPIRKRNTLMLAISGGLIFAGLIFGWLWLTTYAIGLGVLTIACLGGGAYMFRRSWNLYRETGTVIVDKAPVPTKQVNSLCLYPDRVVFEDVYKPEGQPWQCINDGKNYFVQIWEESTKRLKAFILPDQQYYDPGVYAQRVLELPAHRRIFRRKQSLFQKLSPFILIIVIIIEWVVIVTTTGGD